LIHKLSHPWTANEDVRADIFIHTAVIILTSNNEYWEALINSAFPLHRLPVIKILCCYYLMPYVGNVNLWPNNVPHGLAHSVHA
jgi:hypothetical protein